MKKIAADLPYGKYIPQILDKIIELLKLSHDIYKLDKFSLTPDNEDIYKTSKVLVDKVGGALYGLKNLDAHLTEGLFDRHRRDKRYPRIGSLVISSYLEARKANEKSKNYEGLLIPSPLNILMKYLTIPDNQETSAYSLLTCRSILFYYFRFNINKDNNTNEIFDAIGSLKKHIKIQARWPKLDDKNSQIPYQLLPEYSSPPAYNFLVGHFFAMLGITNLWFRKESDLEAFFKIEYSIKNKICCPNYHFRLAYQYLTLPSNSEISNLMFGIPLPISGADTIFFGGLKKAANNSLVISISGSPGSGKTSFALSIAGSLAPFHTKCLYITLEEGEDELRERLQSIIPDFFQDMSIYSNISNKPSKNEDADWFLPYKPQPISDLEVFSKEVLHKLMIAFQQNKDVPTQEYAIQNICPALIVIDNLNGLLNGTNEIVDLDVLQNFIHDCRKLNALVLLVSGENLPEMSKLDYLVDMAIELSNHQVESFEEKPLRVFTLKKSRHQLSRTGSHLFHLSGDDGFRISPQIPSQLDRRTPLRKNLPDDNYVINTLNLEKKQTDKIKFDEVYFKPNLDIFPGSQILIHGNGSSGKAGFALKILMTPPIKKERKKKEKQNIKTANYLWQDVSSGMNFSNYSYQRRVLIISFLYPNEYYQELHPSIQKTIATLYKNISVPKISILYFYPGFLTPEDLTNKITRELDKACLQGEPYTGILLDGMHNVFLQFKKLQERDMIWPMLYNIFSRYDLTVVTTFTNFRIKESMIDYANPDTTLMQKGQTPFLHALVKAADFYIRVDECVFINSKSDALEKHNIISAENAIKQDYENFKLGWDKHNKYIYSLEDNLIEVFDQEDINKYYLDKE
ncbi:MAG: ATPase domain-containing protein [Prolixibacteraceae bacterium]|nr:ATPase domain-containing protein [Prolixibacteraceae bacterium]